jgi:transaldolase
MTSSEVDMAVTTAGTQARQDLEPLALTALTATDYWNDSCSIEDLTYAIERGATGATSNPTIVGEVLTREMPLWRDRLRALIDDNPAWTEDEVSWRLIEEMAVRAAELLMPVFEREHGLKGRLSIQTDPRLYRDAERIVAQAMIEEVTAAGVSINATVCFTVPQAIAVAEAVQRGLTRREADGGDTAAMTPVCTIMVGRLDDWMGACSRFPAPGSACSTPPTSRWFPGSIPRFPRTSSTP